MAMLIDNFKTLLTNRLKSYVDYRGPSSNDDIFTHSSVFRDLLKGAIKDAITSTLVDSSTFSDAIRDSIRQAIDYNLLGTEGYRDKTKEALKIHLQMLKSSELTPAQQALWDSSAELYFKEVSGAIIDGIRDSADGLCVAIATSVKDGINAANEDLSLATANNVCDVLSNTYADSNSDFIKNVCDILGEQIYLLILSSSIIVNNPTVTLYPVPALGSASIL